MTTRRFVFVTSGVPTSDGAGVRLTRMLGTGALPDLDPFLMLDHFRSTARGARDELEEKKALDDELSKKIEEAIKDVRATLEKDDVTADEVNSKVQALATASMKLGEAIYGQGEGQAQEDAAAADAAQDAAQDAEIVDADFEEVDGGDQKK